MDITISPDCHNGKCHACRGDAWNFVLDREADCSCDCHPPAHDPLMDEVHAERLARRESSVAESTGSKS